MLTLLLLLACHPKDDAADSGDSGDSGADSGGDSGSDSAADSGGDSGGDSGDSGETGGDNAATYECGDMPDPPTLSTERWEKPAGAPASTYSAFGVGPGGSPIVVASRLSGAFATTDRGGSWTSLRTYTTHLISDFLIDPGNARRMWVSSGGVLERTTDGGQMWQQVGLGSIGGDGHEANLAFGVAVAPYDGDRLYGLTANGEFSVSTDGGDTFEVLATMPLATSGYHFGEMENFWRVLPDPAPGDSIVITDDASVWVSPSGSGTDWQVALASPLAGRTLVRHPLDPDRVMVIATDGVYASEDGGVSFSRVATGVDGVAAAWSDDGTWLAVLGKTQLWTSTDGVTFTERALGFDAMYAVTIVDDTLYIGWNDGVKRSDDRGQTWQEASNMLIDDGIAVAVPHPACSNRLMIASRCSGGLYHSDDYGSSYTHDEAYFHYVMGVHYDRQDLDHLWAVNDQYLLESKDGGATWETRLQQYHFHGFAIDPENSDRLLVGSVGSGSFSDQSGRVYVSEDSGASWQLSSDGLPDNDSSAHTIAHWPGNPDVVLLGYYKGGDESHNSGNGIGLYRSTDRGASWTRVEGLPGVDVAWLTEAPGGLAAAMEDGLWHSTDEGVTWEKYPFDAEYVLGADFFGDLGLALDGDQQVWRTDDGGVTWRVYGTGMQTGVNVDSWLAMVSIDATGTIAWATDFPSGVYRIGL